MILLIRGAMVVGWFWKADFKKNCIPCDNRPGMGSGGSCSCNLSRALSLTLRPGQNRELRPGHDRSLETRP